MKLREIVEDLKLDVKTGRDNLDKEVTGGYVSDLLSDVMANTRDGNIWITLQIHQNIVAVALLKNLSAIVLVNSRVPENETIQKAKAENIPILVSDLPAFEVVGRLHKMGISGVVDVGGI